MFRIVFAQAVSAAANAATAPATGPVLFPLGRLFTLSNRRTMKATRVNVPAPPGGLPQIFD